MYDSLSFYVFRSVSLRTLQKYGFDWPLVANNAENRVSLERLVRCFFVAVSSPPFIGYEYRLFYLSFELRN